MSWKHMHESMQTHATRGTKAAAHQRPGVLLQVWLLVHVPCCKPDNDFLWIT
jgi:hypothetical protein